jgi:plastocyanin
MRWLLLLLTLAALPATAGSEVHEVQVGDNWYDPQVLVIGMGDTVRWVNVGDDAHTVTAFNQGWGSDAFGPGDSFERAFPEPGPVVYRCIFHPNQWGVLVVGP